MIIFMIQKSWEETCSINGLGKGLENSVLLIGHHAEQLLRKVIYKSQHFWIAIKSFTSKQIFF